MEDIMKLRNDCEKLQLSIKVYDKAALTYTKVSWKNIFSKNGLMAASIYLAATLLNERRSQREVGDICGVSEVTVRNHAKKIRKELF